MDPARRLEIVEAENETLREQVAQLRSALYAEEIELPLEWRLTGSERRVVGVMLSREIATKDAVMTALYDGVLKEEAEPKIVDVFVCKIRKKIAPFGVKIETVWGAGWRLDRDTRARLRSVGERAA